MTDPVILSSGQTYQRDAITEHLKRNKKDPMTNKKLDHKNMVPNMALRHAITAHLADITSDSASMGTQTSPKEQDKKSSSKKQTTRKNKTEDERKKRATAAERRNKKKSGGRKSKHTRKKRKTRRSKKKKNK